MANTTPGPWQNLETRIYAGTTLLAIAAGDGRLERDTCIANARVMAAAPEMLDVLRAIVRLNGSRLDADLRAAADDALMAAGLAATP